MDEQNGQNQKTEFEVKISIGGEISKLRPGMTASADVSTETKNEVVGVPIQSVAVRTIDQLTLEGEEVSDAEERFTADDDGFVEIVFCVEEDGSVVARQVETGIQSDDMIEIDVRNRRGRRSRYRQLPGDFHGSAERCTSQRQQ